MRFTKIGSGPVEWKLYEIVALAFLLPKESEKLSSFVVSIGDDEPILCQR